jgi:hypothetical protein
MTVAAYFPAMIVVGTNILYREIAYLLINVDLWHHAGLRGAPLTAELPTRIFAKPICRNFLGVVVVPDGSHVHWLFFLSHILNYSIY